MNDNTFEIAGITYKIGKMDAFDQFHVARRLAPALFALGGAAASMRDLFGGQAESEEVAEEGEAGATAKEEGLVLSAFEPVAQALAGMSDTDTEYILNKCLMVVMRQVGDQWQKVAVLSQGRVRFMFQDIDLPTMLNIAGKVIKENLGNFFNALPASKM